MNVETMILRILNSQRTRLQRHYRFSYCLNCAKLSPVTSNSLYFSTCISSSAFGAVLRPKILSLSARRYSLEQPRKKSMINITPLSVTVAALMVGYLYYSYLQLEEIKSLEESEQRINALSEAGLGQLNWCLTDQHGKRREHSEFRGQWLMLYFGFCHCPDICPEELEKLTSVVEGIDGHSKSPDILPVFITLDPARDTIQYMNKYCKDFSPKLVGLTGTDKEIAETAKSYRAYYSMGDKDEDGDYIIDHTICMYLINPDGQLIDVYQRSAKVPGIVSGSIKHMSEYGKLKDKLKSPS